MQDIKVSIICNTYNQEDYIGDALDSFLMQKTNFDFEILVHDDASTDGTVDVIRRYEEKYPDIIKPIYQTENQWSKRVKITYKIQIPRAKGKYLAFCEGDDYWIDENKLQKQFDYMESNEDCYVCAHGADMVRADTKTVVGKKTLDPEKERYGMKEAVQGYGRWVATATMFLRREVLEVIPDFAMIAPCGDYIWPILGAEKGYLAYIPDIMSCYRVMAKNSMSQSWAKDHNKLLRYYKRYDDMLFALNEYTKNQYSQEIEDERTRIWYTYYTAVGDKVALKEKRYKNYFKKLPLKTRTKTWVKLYVPFTINIYRKIRRR